jgi:hypothetical protein
MFGVGVTINDGFWIWWLGVLPLICNYSSLWQLTLWITSPVWRMLYEESPTDSLSLYWSLLDWTASMQTEYRSSNRTVNCSLLFCSTQQRSYCWLRYLENVFIEALSGNGRPLRLHSSGFQLSCHNMLHLNSPMYKCFRLDGMRTLQI